jgi:hypothetical protein
MAFQLNNEDMVMLDAEDLAEMGLKRAYDALLPKLKQYVPEPIGIEEEIDHDAPRYAVTAGGRNFLIFAPELGDDKVTSWARATEALFTIVNEQLVNSAYRFYAINGGNDLGGLFLTEEEVDEAILSLPRKADWPYLPGAEDPS